jgi:hypothetical protein
MADAFQCERCEEYNDGTGNELAFGKYTPGSMMTDISVEIRTELCEDCYTEVLDLVREYVEEDGGRP